MSANDIVAPTRHPRPEPSAPRPYHFPRFERRVLPNDTTLVVAPVTKLPVATLMFVFDGGATIDLHGREGVAALTARALLEGTTERTGDALIARLEGMGAAAEAYASWDASVLSLTALADRVDELFALAGEILRTPGFRERDVERLKSERLADLLQLRAEPRGLADESFARVVYESDSRYARPDAGNEESVASLSATAVREFHRANYSSGNLAIIAAGDVTAERIAALAMRTFGDWNGGAPPATTLNDAQRFGSRRVHVVNKPDAAQSEIRIGHVGVSRAHPDYFPLVVMNAILGGLFSSRINLNLREDHGYTYGAFSGFEWRRGAGPFAVSSAVRTEVTGDAVREVLSEIDRMRADRVSADELSLATSYLAGVFPIRYETTDAIAGALANLIVQQLPTDYFDTYRDHIVRVTTDDVLRVARAHLHPDRLQVLVVGDDTVADQLRAIDIGDVTVEADTPTTTPKR